MSNSRLYAKCVRTLLVKQDGAYNFGRQITPDVLDTVTCHGVAPGSPCLMCERDYEETLAQWKRDVAHGRETSEPSKPKRARLADAPCYQALLAESKARGLPLQFKTDLTDHDRWGLGLRHARGERAGEPS